MSIRQGRGMPSGPGGRKPRTSPMLVAIPLVALLLFNAFTGRIDLTNAFDDEDIDGIVRRHLAVQATATAQETAQAQQAVPPTNTTAPLAETAEADATTRASTACEPSGDSRYCLYTVEPGDNLASIATRFGLDGGEVPGWELIFESNKPDLGSLDEALQIGMTLRIPNSIAILHLVLPGDSVSGLAEDYGVTTAEVAAANGLSDPDSVQIGDILIIPEPAQLPPLVLPDAAPEEPAEGELEELPEADSEDGEGAEETDDGAQEDDGTEETAGESPEDGDEAEADADGQPAPESDGGPEERTDNPDESASDRRRDASSGEDGEAEEREQSQDQQPAPEPPPPPAPDDASSMSWPVVQVRITNYMSARHPLGIDLGLGGAPTSPIMAAAGGTVIFAGGDACCSYGYYVIVEHPNGLQTLYAHLSSISVRKGQQVGRGETLGIAGNTGYSRGVHLHFEVYRGGKRVDPMQYLPSP